MVESSIEFDAVLDVCGHEHRRIVLAALADQHQPMTTTDLAETIVEHDRHASLPEVGDETVPRIESSLHHVHLPRLAEAEVIDYDPERHLVGQTAHLDHVEPHLSAILDADPVLATSLEA